MGVNSLFILSGSSCVGKSTILKRLVSDKHCSLAQKYSTRKERRESFDDILHKDKDKLIKSCNITYKMYNMEYGINTNEIQQKLKEGNQGIIISDIEAIKEIKNIFGDNLKIICIILLQRRIENFVNIMFTRDNIRPEKQIMEDIIAKSKELTSAYKENNDTLIKKLDLEFENLVKKCYYGDSFISFWERYKSISNSRDIYNENRDIFKHSISYEDNNNNGNDDVYLECVNIIKEGEN